MSTVHPLPSSIATCLHSILDARPTGSPTPIRARAQTLTFFKMSMVPVRGWGLVFDSPNSVMECDLAGLSSLSRGYPFVAVFVFG